MFTSIMKEEETPYNKLLLSFIYNSIYVVKVWKTGIVSEIFQGTIESAARSYITVKDNAINSVLLCDIAVGRPCPKDSWLAVLVTMNNDRIN